MSYIVTPAPHKLSKTTTSDLMFYQMLGLAICVAMGMIYYKLPAVIVTISCIVAATLTELVCSLIKNRKFVFTDLSFGATALVIAALMPANAQWYYCVIASIVAIASKYLFGGLGNNIFNPAGLGRAVLGVCVAGLSHFALDGGATTLELLVTGQKSSIVLVDVLLGKVNGALGTTCIIAIVAVAVVYMAFRLIRWESVLFAVGGFALIIGVTAGGGYILPCMLSGSFLFVVTFMLTDPVTSPYGQIANVIYSLVFGMLAALFISYNIMGETAVILALLVCNFLAPALDKCMTIFYRGGRNK